MAIVFATKNGNWSDPTVWNTGSLPTTADDVRSNNFTVTVDGTYTVITVGNTSNTSPNVAAGGQFVLANGANLTCTQADSTGILTIASQTTVVFSAASPATATLTANCQASLNNAICVSNSGTGTLTVNANGLPFFAQTNLGARAATNAGVGTLLINGTVNSSTSVSGVCVANTSTGTVTITGNIGGNTLANTGRAVSCASGGTINIFGAVAGGVGIQAPIVPEINTTYNIKGSLTATTAQHAIQTTQASAVIRLSGPFICASDGRHPVFAPYWRWLPNEDLGPTYYEIYTSDLGTTRFLYSGDSEVIGYPVATDVRLGVLYGQNQAYEGLAAIPPASAVSFGTPVDDTTGTAVLNAASLEAALGDGVIERLQNVATVETTGAQLAAFLE